VPESPSAGRACARRAGPGAARPGRGRALLELGPPTAPSHLLARRPTVSSPSRSSLIRCRCPPVFRWPVRPP